MKTDEEVKAERDDAEMMKRPHMWPNLVLPLKRIRDGLMETAVIWGVPEEGEPWILHEGVTMFDNKLGNQVKYASPEAIVQSGWRVD